ncbi:hypothetical protein COCMIDRAFT_35336 [Bipolaris oryzae ATCC 44560]|uniref:Uncharacterized protein n=1 Tax=Bipolaris oryzae ATCC 44560 TaxID=930090 RepID=W6ZB34_COCMI|nr:uncharacterized protein COCMIDRAFT_35336 [Bipolaris oryzae ATCC 44560]EUC47033.1 hypothetical protein COCMIDRAFT_35336 [Bipolaris oryzae ATCC 44560]
MRESWRWLTLAISGDYYQPDCDVKLESLGSRPCEEIGLDELNYDITRHIVTAGTCIGFQNWLAKMAMQLTPTCSSIVDGPLSSLRSTTKPLSRPGRTREYAAAQCSTSLSFVSPGCERGSGHAVARVKSHSSPRGCLAYTHVVVTFMVSNSSMQPIADNVDLRLSTCATQRHAAKPQAPTNQYAQFLKLGNRSTCSLQTHGPYCIFTILSVSTLSNVPTMSSDILQAIDVCRSGSRGVRASRCGELLHCPLTKNAGQLVFAHLAFNGSSRQSNHSSHLGECSPAQCPPRR